MLGASDRKRPRQVVMEVTGSAPMASITVRAGDKSTQQSDVDVPVVLESGERGLRYAVEGGEFVYISAQNSTDSGDVTCAITVDGELLVTNTSSGAYVIATCSGRVP